MTNIRFYNKLFLFFAICFFNGKVSAQNVNDYGFDHWQSPEVVVNAIKLLNPWAGGLNNVQMGKIDLNNDGLDDLIVFDRHGNRLLPFIFTSSPTPSYKYAPSYRNFFPPINHLFQIHDYNFDNKPDIFTYTPGGIMVYRNISTDFLAFEKAVNPFIKSLQGTIYTNLLVTNVDYPSVIDIDGDGDLDILTFWGLGSFVELHLNKSQETYGHADSLLYEKVDFCWGRFAEDTESNVLSLDTCVNFVSRTNDRHTGSTILLMDINQDNALDVVLGDVDFLNVNALINGGTSLDALMVEVIDSFPSAYPVNLTSFPLIQNIDIYNDGVDNITASPFDPSLTRSAGSESVWLYDITESGEFNLNTKSFLQDQMIDVGLGAYPVFAELTGDSLIDLVISNYGRLDTSFYNQFGQLQCFYISSLSFYKNTGTRFQPQFTLVNTNFANLASLRLTGLFPAFADINGDGNKDMILGSSEQNLRYYRNTGLVNGVPMFEFSEIIPLEIATSFNTPALADINKDGVTDLVTGNRNGKLTLFLNTGTATSHSFEMVTTDYGGINVTDSLQSYTGYSVPCFFNVNDARLDLLVGSESGELFYYHNIPASIGELLIPKEDIFKIIHEGIRTCVAMADINSDGYPDMAIGNYSGGLTLFEGKEGGPIGLEEHSIPTKEHSINIYPNPSKLGVSVELPFNGHWQVRIYNTSGQLVKQHEGEIVRTVFMDTENLRSGLYIIVASQIDSSERMLSKKLMVIQ